MNGHREPRAADEPRDAREERDDRDLREYRDERDAREPRDPPPATDYLKTGMLVFALLGGFATVASGAYFLGGNSSHIAAIDDRVTKLESRYEGLVKELKDSIDKSRAADDRTVESIASLRVTVGTVASQVNTLFEQHRLGIVK